MPSNSYKNKVNVIFKKWIIRDQTYPVICRVCRDVLYGVKGRAISTTSKLVACYPLVWFLSPLSRNWSDTVKVQKIHLVERKESEEAFLMFILLIIYLFLSPWQNL